MRHAMFIITGTLFTILFWISLKVIYLLGISKGLSFSELWKKETSELSVEVDNTVIPGETNLINTLKKIWKRKF